MVNEHHHPTPSYYTMNLNLLEASRASSQSLYSYKASHLSSTRQHQRRSLCLIPKNRNDPQQSRQRQVTPVIHSAHSVQCLQTAHQQQTTKHLLLR